MRRRLIGPTGSQVVNVAGVWNYTSLTTGVTGGECVALLLQSSVGTTLMTCERGQMAHSVRS